MTAIRKTPPASLSADWQSPDTVNLARSLAGKLLLRRFADGAVESRMITEVEAYDGEQDLACHARAGLTKRTEVMYAAGGHWYVYLCYGVHEMLNLVTGPPGYPAAILIRGVAGITGPGRLTKSLGINRSLNGLPAEPQSGLWIQDNPTAVTSIKATPRIGIDFAGPVWSAKPWRFVVGCPV